MKQMASPAFGENGTPASSRPLTQLDPIKVEGEDSRDEGGEQSEVDSHSVRKALRPTERPSFESRSKGSL